MNGVVAAAVVAGAAADVAGADADVADRADALLARCAAARQAVDVVRTAPAASYAAVVATGQVVPQREAWGSLREA